MAIDIQYPAFQGRRLSVEPGGLLSGPKLLLNGAPVEKRGGVYRVDSDSGAAAEIRLKYNYFDPVPRVQINNDTLELARPLTWYEYAWMGLPVILILQGGLLGGLLGGLAAAASGRIFRGERGAVAKYALSALVSFGAFALYLAIALFLQSLLSPGQ
ncbi:MAG: hypothetical protein PHV33_05050 [Elusimicrobiales bacterium]|nr:hypothetical protein [Elusimicrobiales bacterium]